jgi:TRAP-type mannitol/chloroaromatic compound transport system substrate-binding protein
VEVIGFPADVMKELKKLAVQVTREESERSPQAKKVYASYSKFQTYIGDWGKVSEGPYHDLIAG